MNCEACREHLIDYIDKNINIENKVLIDEHTEICSNCRKELQILQSVVYKLGKDSEEIVIPSDFISNLHKGRRLVSLSPVRRKKRSLRLLIAAALTFTMSIALISGAPNLIRQLISNGSPNIESSAEASLYTGEKLNLSQTENNVKITVTDVVADDINTLINYTVEDMTSEKRPLVCYFSDTSIAERWGEAASPLLTMNSSYNDNIFHGTLVILPIDTKEKTIHLTFNGIRDITNGSPELVEGNWTFEIPIKRYQSKTFEINKTIHAGGYNIDINKLIVAPTVTKLLFNCRGGSEKEKVNGLQDLSIIVDGKEYTSYGNSLRENFPLAFGNNEMSFESIYSVTPKNIEIKIRRLQTFISNRKEFTLYLDEPTPQEFDYLGSKITVDNLKVDTTINFDLLTPSENREYEKLEFGFTYNNGDTSDVYFSAVGESFEDIYIDETGIKYPTGFDAPDWQQQRAKKAVLFINNQHLSLTPSSKINLKNIKTIKMIIDGYLKTKFLDESIKIELK